LAKAARKQSSEWWVYILECEDGSLYTGISPDPLKRFEAHSRGKGAAYTRSHKPVALLSLEWIGPYSKALRREAQLKRRPKPAKLAYVADPSQLPFPAGNAAWLK
jgi:putative endonuclease